MAVPADVTGVIAVGAGVYHRLAVKAEGTGVAWGDNACGEDTVPTNLAGAIAIAAGPGHSLALKLDGTVAAWGDTYSGASRVPADLTGVIAIAAGGVFRFGLQGNRAGVRVGEKPPKKINLAANLP